MIPVVALDTPIEVTPGNAAFFGGPGLLIHVVNNVGAWGKGFSRDVARHHPRAKSAFLAWRCVYPGHAIMPLPMPVWAPLARTFPPYQLGEVLLHGGNPEHPQVGYAHLCAQSGLPSQRNPTPGSLPALATALFTLSTLLPPPEQLPSGFCIQTVPLCCGYGGQSWSHVEPLIRATLAGYPVRVYDINR